MKDIDIAKSMGQRLIQVRVQAGKSQLELAQDVGISQSQIGKYERGVNRIPPNILQKIADVLNVDIVSFYKDQKNIYEDMTKQAVSGIVSDVLADYKNSINESIPVINLNDLSLEDPIGSINALRKKPVGYLKINDEYLLNFKEDIFALKLEDENAMGLGFYSSTFIIFSPKATINDINAVNHIYLTISENKFRVTSNDSKKKVIAIGVASYTRL